MAWGCHRLLQDGDEAGWPDVVVVCLLRLLGGAVLNSSDFRR